MTAQKEPGEPLAQLGVAPNSEKAPGASRQRREEPAPDVDDDGGDRATAGPADPTADPTTGPAAGSVIGPVVGSAAPGEPAAT